MAGSKALFDEFLAEEVKKTKGVYFPVKTGLLRRLLTREARCKDLHPNPEDEFSMPEVGPNYEIISRYQKQYVDALKTSYHFYDDEPIIVERTHPDGYRIINGHHRWAAVVRIGQPKIPVKVVNLTHEDDVKRILANSKHTKRVSLDLDEVVFREEGEGALEKALPFPWNKLYPQRIRRGIPALFHFLAKYGYDVWLYSAKYYSTDYIQNYFRKYHVKITGILTATEKQASSHSEARARVEKLIAAKYQSTLHIDNEMVLQSAPGSKDFRDFYLRGEEATWSQEVMDAVMQLEKQGKETEVKP